LAKMTHFVSSISQGKQRNFTGCNQECAEKFAARNVQGGAECWAEPGYMICMRIRTFHDNENSKGE
jgi:hypothetical protein